MDGLFKSAKDITKTREGVDDTLADRLSSKYTAGILMFFAAFAMTRATFGSPLTCWMPVHFTGSHTKYTNRSLLCILNISSTYYCIHYFCGTPRGIILVTASWKFVQSIIIKIFAALQSNHTSNLYSHLKHEIFDSKLWSASLPCKRTTSSISTWLLYHLQWCVQLLLDIQHVLCTVGAGGYAIRAQWRQTVHYLLSVGTFHLCCASHLLLPALRLLACLQ